MNANTSNAALVNAAAAEVQASREPLSNRFIADSLFAFGRQVRDHVINYPRIFADRVGPEAEAQRRRALDTCSRLAREFEYLAFQAFVNDALPEVNREQLEAVVMDLRERIADINLAGTPAA